MCLCERYGNREPLKEKTAKTSFGTLFFLFEKTQTKKNGACYCRQKKNKKKQTKKKGLSSADFHGWLTNTWFLLQLLFVAVMWWLTPAFYGTLFFFFAVCLCFFFCVFEWKLLYKQK